MTKKYKIDYTKELLDSGCFRIVALRDFADVKVGELGGWIESEENLSHSGDCWVYDGKVCGRARVVGNAKIKEAAFIQDNSIIRDDATIIGGYVSGCSVICGNTEIQYQNTVNKIIVDNEVKEEVSNVDRLVMEVKSLSHNDYIEFLGKLFDE